MITKNDCLSILVKLEDSGVKNIDTYMRKLLVSREIPLEVLKFMSVYSFNDFGTLSKSSPIYSSFSFTLESSSFFFFLGNLLHPLF